MLSADQFDVMTSNLVLAGWFLRRGNNASSSVWFSDVSCRPVIDAKEQLRNKAEHDLPIKHCDYFCFCFWYLVIFKHVTTLWLPLPKKYLHDVADKFFRLFSISRFRVPVRAPLAQWQKIIAVTRKRLCQCNRCSDLLRSYHCCWCSSRLLQAGEIAVECRLQGRIHAAVVRFERMTVAAGNDAPTHSTALQRVDDHSLGKKGAWNETSRHRTVELVLVMPMGPRTFQRAWRRGSGDALPQKRHKDWFHKVEKRSLTRNKTPQSPLIKLILYWFWLSKSLVPGLSRLLNALVQIS